MDYGDVEIDYTNHHGERAIRRIIPRHIFWSSGNEWHPEPQWLLYARDLEKDADRTFAMKDIHSWKPIDPEQTEASQK